MSLKRLAVRTKKSLSGLLDSPKEPAYTTEKVSNDLVDFGAGSSIDSSPSKSLGKGSPSRRNRFFESLRRKKAGNRSISEMNIQPPIGDETPLERKKPSLALNFEVSPPDQPIFDTTRKSLQASEIEVHRSSPITVPSAVKENMSPLQVMHPEVPGFSVGTIPDSPAPLHLRLIQETFPSFASFAADDFSTMQSSDATPLNSPLPTPLPGTNIPIQGVSKSEDSTASCPQTRSECTISQAYFDIPLHRIHGLDEHSIKTSTSARTAEIPIASRETDASFKLDDPFQDTVPDEHQLRSLSLRTTRGHGSDGRAIGALDHESLEDKSNVVSAYLAMHDDETSTKDEKQTELNRSEWGQHTGLYDGTGYGSDGESPTIVLDLFAAASILSDDFSEMTVDIALADDEIDDTNVDRKDNQDGMEASKATESKVSVDDHSLHDIIHAYVAGSEREQGGESEERTTRMAGSWPRAEDGVYEDGLEIIDTDAQEDIAAAARWTAMDTGFSG
ncbi:hypothetical protein EJ04DRAFT_529009 [Polyplosphaeria fusca]|uniref:Uncharacterized protein n=1 Tax=Polyplosphaeria fusca TaxID=682080 RepID=A0A9P4QM38_9PLEO|nr:hypothetical protein EJ04DRAFT_529009 [Polyplosphaeria fusca]